MGSESVRPFQKNVTPLIMSQKSRGDEIFSEKSREHIYNDT